MKYCFKGSVSFYNEKGNYLSSESYYLNEKNCDIDFLRNMIKVCEIQKFLNLKPEELTINKKDL